MSEVLVRRFASIGARLELEGPPIGRPTIDVGADGRGEFFTIRFSTWSSRDRAARFLVAAYRGAWGW